MQDKNSLNIVIDVGSDTTKVVFSFVDDNNKIIFGKLGDIATAEFSYPSIAYYDSIADKWIFGADTYAGSSSAFDKLIKIKELLKLLDPVTHKTTSIVQSDYYYRGHDFFKFYFPKLSDQSKVLKDEISCKRTFKAKQTPQQVCEMFFVALYDCFIKPALLQLRKIHPRTNNLKVKYHSTYPIHSTNEYIAELERLICKMSAEVEFGKSVSSSKSASIFAYHCGLLGKQSKSLVFDIGESTIAVSKIISEGAGINIDGADGHNLPEEIGGQTYDEMLRNLVEYKFNERAMLGSNGETRQEQGTHRQQFFLMEDIKKSKQFFALQDTYDKIFANGVPICAHRDVTVETTVTQAEFLRGIRTTSGIHIGGANEFKYGPSSQIADYILRELKRGNNTDIDTVLLTGGVAQTYDLLKFVRSAISVDYGNKINVITLSITQQRPIIDDKFDINSYDYPIFSVAVGGSIYATDMYSVKMIAPLSYGTWSTVESPTRKYLFHIIIKKGFEYNPDGGEVTCAAMHTSDGTTQINGEEFFSANTTENIIVGKNNGVPEHIRDRDNAINHYGLKVLCGADGKGKIAFVDAKTKRPVTVNSNFYFVEGIRYDRDGRATPFARGERSKNRFVLGADRIEVQLIGVGDFTLIQMETGDKK